MPANHEGPFRIRRRGLRACRRSLVWRRRVAQESEQHRRRQRLFWNEQFIVGFEFGWCVRDVLVVIRGFVVIIRGFVVGHLVEQRRRRRSGLLATTDSVPVVLRDALPNRVPDLHRGDSVVRLRRRRRLPVRLCNRDLYDTDASRHRRRVLYVHQDRRHQQFPHRTPRALLRSRQQQMQLRAGLRCAPKLRQ